jgi:hypothetical protein
MAFVDPERFKRFEQFVAANLRVFADAAGRGYAKIGPGVLMYHAPDDRFDPPTGPFRFEYRSKAEIDALHATARDELLQGMLERYKPPGEALFLAIYKDNTYDISRVTLGVVPHAGGPGAGEGPGAAAGGEPTAPN